jgi:tRNA-2-methylthio-N6-dimethylallyladenosine synthase
VQERFERLVALQNHISFEENQAQIGRTVDVLVANGEGKKDSARHRMSGRAPDMRLVHFEIPDGAEIPRPGDVVTVTITEAAPYHLLADTGYSLRRTRAGDAWDRSQAESCGVPAGASTPVAMATPVIGLGMPGRRPN